MFYVYNNEYDFFNITNNFRHLTFCRFEFKKVRTEYLQVFIRHFKNSNNIPINTSIMI